jgi:nitroimidazol reductase NimA-like FMN-containing flavoprotein (pyridoxamine 5'-phosphate oxidase superfamily)
MDSELRAHQSNTDLRGQMFRVQRQMSPDDARAFLAEQKIANIGTVDADGWPYVVPLAFIYERTEELWFHTGWHEGHLFHNLKHNSKLCLEAAGIGKLTPPVKQGYACNSSLLYSSVIVFGTAEVIEATDKKTWFFDRMVEKYGDPSLEFKPGYPMLDRIILFRMAIEIITAKENDGLSH